MQIFRKILKTILQRLAIWTIKKHSLSFIVVAGWYGTDLVKDAIYQVLNDRVNIRRNIKKIWWDFSLPLVILGYEDKKYTFFGWIAVIFKSLYTLFAYPPNCHKVILNINLADKDTTDYWSKIITPELLLIINYKRKQSFLIHKLIRKTKSKNGKIFIANTIKIKEFNKFDKFAFKTRNNKKILTPENSFEVHNKLPVFQMEIFAPVVSAAEYYGWSRSEILNSLSKIDLYITEKITQKIKAKLN